MIKEINKIIEIYFKYLIYSQLMITYHKFLLFYYLYYFLLFYLQIIYLFYSRVNLLIELIDSYLYI